MSAIQRRIQSCLEHCEREDWEGAFVNLWPAIDATAHLRYSGMKSVGDRIRHFLRDETRLILAASESAVIARNVTVGGMDLAEALYKLSRNAITHEGHVDPKMSFRAGPYVEIGADLWNLPSSYIRAMALAVILSVENGQVSDSSGLSVEVHGRSFRLNQLWGRPELMHNHLRKVGRWKTDREAT